MLHRSILALPSLLSGLAAVPAGAQSVEPGTQARGRR
jgi:hypothetical protein